MVTDVVGACHSLSLRDLMTSGVKYKTLYTVVITHHSLKEIPGVDVIAFSKTMYLTPSMTVNFECVIMVKFNCMPNIGE